MSAGRLPRHSCAATCNHRRAARPSRLRGFRRARYKPALRGRILGPERCNPPGRRPLLARTFAQGDLPMLITVSSPEGVNRQRRAGGGTDIVRALQQSPVVAR